MSAYIIVEIEIVDPVGYEEYKKLAGASVEKYGGKYIVRGGKTEVLEGEWQHPRTVIIEFPTRSAAEAWYGSPPYQSIIHLRQKSTSGNLVILDGASG